MRRGCAARDRSWLSFSALSCLLQWRGQARLEPTAISSIAHSIGDRICRACADTLKRGISRGPAYLSYHGFASPAFYRVPAIQAYSSMTIRPPPLQILSLPDGKSDEFLRDFLRTSAGIRQ